MQNPERVLLSVSWAKAMAETGHQHEVVFTGFIPSVLKK